MLRGRYYGKDGLGVSVGWACFSTRRGPMAFCQLIGLVPFTSINMTFDEHLQRVGLELPTPSTPGANYIQFVRSGELLFLTGQLCQWNGERRHIGKLGRELGIAAGQDAARLCALNLLAHLRVAVENDFDRVTRCLRVTGYVNATDDFTQHSQVINGASDVFVQAFGDAGRHTRVAIGTNGLPYGVAVEVEAVFELRPVVAPT